MCELCNDRELDKIREAQINNVHEQELKEMIEKTKYGYMIKNGWSVDSILYPMFR